LLLKSILSGELTVVPEPKVITKDFESGTVLTAQVGLFPNLARVDESK